MLETNVTLPEDFDGLFRFTNFTDKEFKAKWGGIEYTFPPKSRNPLIISTATPVEIQSIRKKFAKELAILEFYKTPKFVGMNIIQPGGTPALYTDSDLAPFIQRCLEPLPEAKATVKVLDKADENTFLRKDKRGKNVTKVLDEDESLIGEGTPMN